MKVIFVIDIISNFYLLFELFPTNCDILGSGLHEILKDIYKAIEIATPILVIALCTMDVAKAVAAQDEKDMNVAQARIIKRIIIGLAIFLMPTLLDAILKVAGFATGICDIGL